MRPKNSDIMAAVAGEVLAECMQALREAGISLSLSDMRNLVERVEVRIGRLQQEKKASGNGSGARVE